MPDTTAAATLLTSALSMTLDPLEIAERLRVPPIFEMSQGNHAPLDLNADVFRYRILASGRIVVVPSHGRACWSAHSRHRVGRVL
jgi:hypothetical protein